MKHFKTGIAILWMSFVSIAYYKLFPFIQLIEGVSITVKIHFTGSVFVPLLLLIFMLLSAEGWGSFIWHAIELSHFERIVFSIACGLGIISILTALLALGGVLSTPVYSALLLLGVILFFISIKKMMGELVQEMSWWGMIVAIPLLLSFVVALAPPTYYDSLVYHLALPAQYIAQGKLMPPAHAPFFFSFPQNMEMLYTGALLLNSEALTGLLHWIFFPLTVVMIYLYMKRFHPQSDGVLAAVIYAFTPAVLFVATGTYVDIALTFYIFAGFYSVKMLSTHVHMRWMVISGFMLGIAAGIKYTGIIAVPLVCCIAVYYLIQKTDLTVMGKYLLALIAVFIVALAPWLLKNIMYLNNPVAPFLTGVFPGDIITSDIAQKYIAHIRSHGVPITTIYELIKLPWRITAYGFRYGGGFDLWGPLFLMFIPVSLLGKKIWRDETIIIALFVVVYGIAWLSAGKVLRFLLPMTPFLAILAAESITTIVTHGRMVRAIVFFLLVVGIINNTLLFHWNMTPINPYKYVIESETRDQYLKRTVNSYGTTSEYINKLPKSAKILAWGETRRYFIKPDAIVPSVFDTHPFITWITNASTPEELHRALQTERITHLLVNRLELDRLSLMDGLPQGKDALYFSFINEKTDKTYEDGCCTVYELK